MSKVADARFRELVIPAHSVPVDRRGASDKSLACNCNAELLIDITEDICVGILQQITRFATESLGVSAGAPLSAVLVISLIIDIT
jgi:hypothetical protein